MPTKTPTKTKKTQIKSVNSKLIKSKPKLNKKLFLLLTLVIAVIGAYFLFFASAGSHNCQAQDGVQICDVDMVAGGSDTVLSTDGEAEILSNQGWGMYFGTNFRAPRSAYKGAVPITRVVNESVALHDWVTQAQKNAKEAKYGALRNEGVVFYAWEGPGVPGTVPVYRVGATNGGGTGAKNMYSVDKAWIDKILAADANNPEGWKADKFGPLIAFYAYPPGYAVANAPNPYDCSIEVNFLSDRCKTQREALLNAEKAGTLPAAPTASGYSPCPATYQLYKSAPIGAKFDAACQKKWNAYAQDCSKQENFLSDNCKGPREALIAENNRQLELKRQAAERARQQQSGGGGIVPGGGSGGGNPLPTPPRSTDPNVQVYYNRLAQVRLWCANLNPPQAADPNTLQCIPAKIGINRDTARRWNCKIFGWSRGLPENYQGYQEKLGYRAINEATARRICTEFASSYNRQNDFWDWKVISVYQYKDR